MTDEPQYLNYWKRKQLIDSSLPNFPVRKWWAASELCETEQIILAAVKDSPDLLDVGAGDLRLKNKLQAAGYRGQYDTQDIGVEFSYTFTSLAEVSKKYRAILCLDLIEHLPLGEGLRLLHTLIDLLADNGVLILQTPNARCVRDPMSTDMTHLHCYNLSDLWAYFTALGLAVDGYRVVFINPRASVFDRIRLFASAFVTTRLLGTDYADNILLIARKPSLGIAK